jgi:hypothetical protein
MPVPVPVPDWQCSWSPIVTSAGEPQWVGVASSNHPGPARPGMLVASQEPDSPPSPSREAAQRRPGCPRCPPAGHHDDHRDGWDLQVGSEPWDCPFRASLGLQLGPSIATDPDPGTGGKSESARIDIPSAAPVRRRSPGRLDGDPLVRWPAVPNGPSPASLRQQR